MPNRTATCWKRAGQLASYLIAPASSIYFSRLAIKNCGFHIIELIVTMDVGGHVLIQFPVIRRLEVKNYELFETDKSEGITHTFEHGVHAVVGINGLGKTTLLTILYRALLGPYDQSKSDDAGLLGSQHKLSAWRNKGYFRDRVSDGAAKATAEVDVAFGDSLVTIRRRLNTLQIEYLSINGKVSGAQTPDARDEEYQTAVVQLSGVANFFDFFAVLRYLVFFLEDRIELIWDRRSQFDMLRVLLFDTASAQATSDAYDKAQAADSRFRNRRAILNKDKDRLAAAEAAVGDTQAAQFRALQAAIAQAEDRDRLQIKQIEEAREKVENTRLKRERGLLDLQEARTALEFEEQAHYRHLFPDLDETAQHIFLNILSGGGCLVCGSTGPDIAEHLRSKLAEHRCPVCDSAPERQEKIVTPADFSKAKLSRLSRKVEQLRQAVITSAEDINRAEDEYEELMGRRDEDREQLRQLRLEVARLGYNDLPTKDQLESLRSAVREGDRELERLLAERTAAERKYGSVVRRQKALIDKTVSAIRKGFRHYASLILAERCELNIDKEKRSIGEEGPKFEFPYFEVMMTSGVFDQSLSTRSSKDAVSQSQAEFLDVAFRLALIDAVTGKSASMMVVETPESSLDSLFVTMVGQAFRSYGEDIKRKNVFIASTNLNNEEMLSALLGIVKVPKVERARTSEANLGVRQPAERVTIPAIPKNQRKDRIINLLELAAPNAALREHRTHYMNLFKSVIGES